MHIEEFKHIITTFADKQANIDMTKNELAIEIKGQIIIIKVFNKDGDLWITENGIDSQASRWIIDRLAQLPMLANRIIEYIKEEPFFVEPAGEWMDEIEKNPNDLTIQVPNVLTTIGVNLNQKNALSSNVFYLTSHAGEGKTTIINQLARQQAIKYKEKKTDWLLIPIELGGRTFLRFDDIIVAVLMNKLKFSMLYYDSFIELIKLGVIVPAFDGFEEVFMVSSSGEALSAIGNLVNNMKSTGRILISARKAYFDYIGFTSLSKIFDTVKNNAVSFSKLSINRWTKTEFISYATKRGIQNPDKVYDLFKSNINTDYHVLTRAVLVKKLLDVFSDNQDFSKLAQKLGGPVHEQFTNFINAIIERESDVKWIDRSGEPQNQLISYDDHHQLLAMIAEEMWISHTSALSADIIDTLADTFSEDKHLSPSIAYQIKERLKQHALIVTTDNKSFSFDHDEFKQFFLGELISIKIMGREIPDTKLILKIGVLPQQTLETLVYKLKNNNKYDIGALIDLVSQLCKGEPKTSFVRENCGSIILKLVNQENLSQQVNIEQLFFGEDALADTNIKNILFRDCYFQATSLKDSNLINCTFIDCIIERLELYPTTNITNVIMEKNSKVQSIYDSKGEDTIFDPESIIVFLTRKGITFKDKLSEKTQLRIDQIKKTDEKLKIAERIFLRFSRSTYLTESVFQTRLGSKYSTFKTDILPALLKKSIITEVSHSGGGSQKRYKLEKYMNDINSALTKCEGSFDKFIEYFEE